MDEPERTDVVVIGMGPGGEYPTFYRAIEDALRSLEGSS